MNRLSSYVCPFCTLCLIHDLLLLPVTKLLRVGKTKIYIFILLPCGDLLSHGKGLFRILLRLNLIGSCEWFQIFTFSRLTSSSSIQKCHFMAHLEHFYWNLEENKKVSGIISHSIMRIDIKPN